MKPKSRKAGPADLTDEGRYDGAQWYYYKFLARAELMGIPKAEFVEPEAGEI